MTKVATGSYIISMRAVGIKTLKNKLSEYVRLAAAGETVLVADRDRIVAELVPPRDTRAVQVSDALLADLIRRGVITPPLIGPGPPPPAPRVANGSELLKELAADRDER